MDNVIKSYRVRTEDEYLCYCSNLAYQKDMNQSVEYGESYYNTYVERENTDIAKKLNKARTELSEKYCKNIILDIGIGSGEFIKNSNLKVYGYDINPYGVKWLEEHDLYVDPYKKMPSEIEGVTLWDTLEHIPSPQCLFQTMKPWQYIFISLPTFDSVHNIRKSKHFKPNEHYYYFTIPGMIEFMEDSGFKYIEHNDNETKAGREGITAFVFQKRYFSMF